jgi:hypothetical protein
MGSTVDILNVNCLPCPNPDVGLETSPEMLMRLQRILSSGYGSPEIGSAAEAS